MDTCNILVGDLNSKLLFSYTTCLTKAREPKLFYYFTHHWNMGDGVMSFSRVLENGNCTFQISKFLQMEIKKLQKQINKSQSRLQILNMTHNH